jgi:homoserine acetyltransferase
MYSTIANKFLHKKLIARKLAEDGFLPFSTTITGSSSTTSSRVLDVGKQKNRHFSKVMKDEYGHMTAEGDSFVKKNFTLENQSVLAEAQLRYQTYGALNEARDNVLVICHALTGNASLDAWWGGLLGDNKAFDTSKYFVVCCNILGSCYGSSNPRSIDPTKGSMFGMDFPDISVQDTVRLQLHLLKEEIGVSSIKAVIGGSFGGMQAMEFAAQAGSSSADFLSEDGKEFSKIIVFAY